jgi:GDPmannose 4,6-dehydratase
MWLILQQERPDDYVIATGEKHSVRDFVEVAFREIGVEIAWRGEGVDEVGIVRGVHRNVGGPELSIKPDDVVLEVDPRYFRPTEVDLLLGDPSKARSALGWKPAIAFEDMVSQMVKEDLEGASRDQLCKESGFRVLDFHE